MNAIAHPVMDPRLAALDRRRAATAIVCGELQRYARRHGGRFLIYGSVARHSIRADSDIDILVDFPPASEADAWRFAEEACGSQDLPYDIRPLNWCTPAFIRRIEKDLLVLQ